MLISMTQILNSIDSIFHNYILTVLFQTYMSFFLMLNIKEDILKNAGNQTVDVPC